MSLRMLGAAMAVLMIGLAIAVPVRALAHESRDVGKYQFVVGFLVEPAYEGQKNGLDLRVRVPAAASATSTPAAGATATPSAATATPTATATPGVTATPSAAVTSTPTPVTGLEKTLQVEVSFVGNDKKVTKPIRAISASTDPGHYTADVLPTQPGQYRFRIFGTIDGANVNETFTSGDKFGNVAKIDDINFPDAVPQVRSVQGTATDAQVTAEDAAKAASQARLFAIAGIAIGVLGLGAGLRASMMKRA